LQQFLQRCFFANKQSQSTIQKEKYLLNADCADRALKFAGEHEIHDDFSDVYYKLIDSQYSPNDGTCFAEYNVSVLYFLTSEASHSDYRIYDILKKQELATLTYWVGGDTSEKTQALYDTMLPAYEKAKELNFQQ